MTERGVAFPRYNLTRIFTLRNWLTDDVLSDFAGFAPVGASFDEFVDIICGALGRVNRQVVLDSVRDVAGTIQMDADIYRLAWRLAGNLTRMRDGVPVPPWNTQREKEWVPVQIVSYKPAESRQGRSGGDFVFRILAGTPCPMRINKFMTTGFARQNALRMGYSRLRGKSPFGHISELVGLRMWIELDPEQCSVGRPGFDHVGCSSGLKKWNMSIINKRFRRGWECPHQYDHYCFDCHVGYQQCPAATHQVTINVNPPEGSNGAR